MESSTFLVTAELQKYNSVDVSELRGSGHKSGKFSFESRVGCFTSADITEEISLVLICCKLIAIHYGLPLGEKNQLA